MFDKGLHASHSEKLPDHLDVRGKMIDPYTKRRMVNL